MGYRLTEFADGEWYHCYSRSIDRQPVFREDADYLRFLESLYLCNSERPVLRGALHRPSHEKIMTLDRGTTIVGIGAYCIMPNHFHILLRQSQENGISKFMQKLGTSFSMYFNTKYAHVGNVFIKPFRAKYIGTDDYFQHVIQYIHLNPAELYETGWKQGMVQDLKGLEGKLANYPYSSLPDHIGVARINGAIIDDSVRALIPKSLKTDFILKEAADYYREINL